MNEKVNDVNQLLREGEPLNISVDDYSGFTGYKPQYIIDAMNEVFWGSWGFEEVSSDIVEGEKGALAICQVKVWLLNDDLTPLTFQPVGWGQSRVTKGDYGDARKGAQTDAIKKALSYYSIGNRAYHGLLPGGRHTQSEPQPSTNGTVKNTLHNSPPSPSQINEIARLAKELGMTVKKPATYKEASDLHGELARQYNAREVHPA